jgi:hypothetical protein
LHLGNLAGHNQTVNLEAFDPGAVAVISASCNIQLREVALGHSGIVRL